MRQMVAGRRMVRGRVGSAQHSFRLHVRIGESERSVAFAAPSARLDPATTVAVVHVDQVDFSTSCFRTVVWFDSF